MNSLITTLCCECRKEIAGKIENYRYTECGLRSIVLKNILVFHCDHCGATMPQLAATDVLHRMIALHLLTKENLLDGEEVRYLRKFTDFTQSEFAKALGVHKTQISQWEKGLKKITKNTDRLIRLTCVMHMTSGDLSDSENLDPNAVERTVRMLTEVQDKLQNVTANVDAKPKQYMIDPNDLDCFAYQGGEIQHSFVQ